MCSEDPPPGSALMQPQPEGRHWLSGPGFAAGQTFSRLQADFHISLLLRTAAIPQVSPSLSSVPLQSPTLPRLTLASYLFEDEIAEQEVEGGQPGDRQCSQAGYAFPWQLLQVLSKKYSKVTILSQAPKISWCPLSIASSYPVQHQDKMLIAWC